MNKKQQRQRAKEMKEWLKLLLQWEIENPDRDWATALFGVESQDDGGGSNPPPIPPKPPVQGG